MNRDCLAVTVVSFLAVLVFLGVVCDFVTGGNLFQKEE